MTTVGGHRLATIAVGDDTFALVVDNRMWARTFANRVRALELIFRPRRDALPSQDFELDFGSGLTDYTVSMVTPAAGTGFLSAAAMPPARS